MIIVLSTPLKNQGVNSYVSVIVNPQDFCNKWVKFKPRSRRNPTWGLNKAHFDALMGVLGVAKSSVSRWGDGFTGCPDTVKITLAKEDIINQIREITEDTDLSEVEAIAKIKKVVGSWPAYYNREHKK